MKEKEIMQVKNYNIGKITLIIIGASFIVSFLFATMAIQSDPFYAESDFAYKMTSAYPYFMSFIFIPMLIIALLFYFSAAKVSLTVTDKRVYGTAIFGKRVDLPLDMISAVSTSIFKGIGISTASGVIKFWGIRNNMEVHKAISDLLLERQDKKTEVVTEKVSSSSADEIKKYKELLDSGAITQEEYDAKKNELLKL